MSFSTFSASVGSFRYTYRGYCQVFRPRHGIPQRNRHMLYALCHTSTRRRGDDDDACFCGKHRDSGGIVLLVRFPSVSCVTYAHMHIWISICQRREGQPLDVSPLFATSASLRTMDGKYKKRFHCHNSSNFLAPKCGFFFLDYFCKF
jgi:hypothetical protein